MSAASPVARPPVVLDTNVVSELMRSAPDAGVVNWVSQVPPAAVYTTAVTLAEVRYGIARLPASRRRTVLDDAADEVFGTFADRVLPFDSVAAAAYADIVVERDHAGAPISGFNAQIAAICRANRATLATRNLRGFDHLALDVVDPWVAGL